MNLLLTALDWNFVLVTSMLASITAQIIKVIINLVIFGRFIPERMWGAGGMPSSHSATVCAMVVATARFCGVHSTLFALAVVIAVIVMYDAMGVRRQAGEHAKVLNDLVDCLQQDNIVAEDLTHNFKELLGHTPLQVAAGFVLGLLMGCLVN